jgi:predicted CxxxxCH...CXXCH cytochrome family protein
MRLHINSTATIRGYYNKPVGNPAAFINQTSAPVMSTCNNVNCHFRTNSPAWGATPLTGGQTVANCQICHLSTGMNTGDHSKHIAAFGNTITACSKCHPDNTTFTHATSAKFGRSITVTLAGAPFATGTYAASTHAAYPNYFTATGYGSCNTVYCHSSVQSTTGGTPPIYQRVTWGLSTLACNGCHGNTAATLLSGSHSSHLLATYAFACTDCHGTAGGAGNTAIHANGSINVDLTNRGTNGTYMGDSIPQNSNFNVCNNTNCHGRNSAVWGTAGPTNGVCTTCHGQLNYAYTNVSASQIAPGGAGVDTGGLSAATDPRVGTHQNHLTGAMGISAPIHCGECHIVQTAVIGGTHLGYTTARISFGAIAKSNAHTPATTRVSGLINCSTNHCHTGKTNTGLAPTPVWNNTSYLTGAGGAVAIVPADCKQCHALPPTPGAGSHVGVATVNAFPVGTSCGCHTNLSTTGTLYNNIFADKTKHVDGTVQAGHSFPYPGSAHMTGGTGNPTANAAPPYTNCNTCHTNISAGGTYPVARGNAALITCSNCHKDFTNFNSASNGCNDCHGDATGRPSNNAVIGNVFPNISGSHGKHVVALGLACSVCHGAYGTGSPNHGSSGGVASAQTTAFVHVTSTTKQFGDFTFTKKDRVTAGKGSCNNNACHGLAEWGVDKLDCISCHSATVAIAHGPLTGGQRAAVAASLKSSGTRNHKSTAVGSDASKWDCIVCHMEGNASTGSADSAFHGNGVIEFRDPDTGIGIKKVKWSGSTYNTTGPNTDGGRWVSTLTNMTTSRFSRDFSKTLDDDPSRDDIASIQMNLCLKCHDNNGAANSSAWTRNAAGTVIGTAMRPFGNAAANTATVYQVATGITSAAGGVAGNVMNVFSQFSSGNASYHPIRGRQNNGYTTGSRMSAPWGNTTKAYVKGSTTVWGYMLSCFDCHAANRTGVQTSTVVAHGNGSTTAAATLIAASAWTATTNLCTNCHAGYTQSTSYHGTGSAWTAVGQSHNTSVCAQCHTNNSTNAQGLRAVEAHGFNVMMAGGTGNTFGTRPYAFIRSATNLGNWRPGTCQSTSGCTGATGYTPGGAY